MEGEGTKHGPPCGPGPWTTYMDRGHGPLTWTGAMDHLCGPGPWTPIFLTRKKKHKIKK